MDLGLNAKKTALIVIDLEHGIVQMPGLAPYSSKEVVTRAVKLADGLRAKGGAVVWTHVLLHEMLRLPVDQQTQPPEVPPANASDLIAEVTVQPGDTVITKRQWGAFYGTNLEQTLRRQGIETIVMAGIVTNMGVESTARAAFDAGYALVFAEDAMTAISVDGHAFSTKNSFPMMGKVGTTEEILASLK